MFAPLLPLEDFLSARQRRPILPLLRELLGAGTDVRLLDLGGGTGAVGAALAQDFGRVIVVEPNPRKIAFGRRRHAEVEFIEGHGEDIPFPEASFDRVAAFLSFHHMEDQDRALEEMRRVLKPSGRAVLEELYPSSPVAGFARIAGGDGRGERPRFYEPGDLKRTMEGHGFREVSLHPSRRSYFALAVK